MAEHLAGINEVFPRVVACALFRVGQGFVRLANLFEFLGGVFIVGVFIRMMHNRQLAIRSLNLPLPRILLHTKDLVKVLALALLELELCIPDFFLDAGFLGVGLGDGFVFAEGVFPGAGVGEGAGFRFAGFEIGGVEGESAGAVGEGGGGVFDLRERGLAFGEGMGIWRFKVRGGDLPLGRPWLGFGGFWNLCPCFEDLSREPCRIERLHPGT